VSIFSRQFDQPVYHRLERKPDSLEHVGIATVGCEPRDGIDFVEDDLPRGPQKHVYSGEAFASQRPVQCERGLFDLICRFGVDPGGHMYLRGFQRVFFRVVKKALLK